MSIRELLTRLIIFLVSFSSTLFSKEFFEIANKHLTKNGLFVQWLPIYEMDIEEFKRFYNTFTAVFPYVVAFANVKENENFPIKLKTSEIIFVGSNDKIDLNVLNKSYMQLPDKSKESLASVRLYSVADIENLIIFTSEQLQGYAKGYGFITDDKPSLEYSTAKHILTMKDSEPVLKNIEKFLEKAKRGS